MLTTQTNKNMEEYTAATIIVLYSSILLERETIVDAFLETSLMVLGLPRENVHGRDLLGLMENPNFNETCAKIKTYLEEKTGGKFLDIYLTEIKSWPNSIAPWIWKWIHPTTHYIDCNFGLEMKKKFILLLQPIILCSECLSHYVDNIPSLVDSLRQTCLENTFIALHTHIREGKTKKFKYSPALLDRRYKVKTVFK